jgi:transketolase
MTNAVSVRETFGQTLKELAKNDERIVVLDADLMKVSGTKPFLDRFPERHFQVGIAEANMVGIAAGMAALGKVPFVSTFANFAARRACDQAAISVAYNRFNVKICGDYAGLTAEKNGATHISVEDIAIYRSMPNMTVIVPGDCTELKKVLQVITEYDGPVYLRKPQGPLYKIFDDDYKFEIGKAVTLKEGSDITLITTGITTWEGKKACEILKPRGISIRHIHMPTIKPLDKEVIVKAARETGAIITVENHSRLGGLGSAITEVVCDYHPAPVVRLGIDDAFGETATFEWLMAKFGIDTEHIITQVESILKRKKL